MLLYDTYCTVWYIESRTCTCSLVIQAYEEAEAFCSEFMDQVDGGSAHAHFTPLKQIQVLLVEKAKTAKICIVELVSGKALQNHQKACERGDEEGMGEALRVLRQQSVAFAAGNKLGLLKDDIHPTLVKLMNSLLET